MTSNLKQTPLINTIEYELINMLYGEYYGYPKCCIKSFKYSMHKKENVQAEQGYGFIPCDKHTEDIYNRKIKIHDLINNRICKYNFPYDPNEYINKLEYNNIILKFVNGLKQLENACIIKLRSESDNISTNIKNTLTLLGIEYKNFKDLDKDEFITELKKYNLPKNDFEYKLRFTDDIRNFIKDIVRYVKSKNYNNLSEHEYYDIIEKLNKENIQIKLNSKKIEIYSKALQDDLNKYKKSFNLLFKEVVEEFIH